MNEISISIRKEIDKIFCNFLNKESCSTQFLEGNLFHITFDPLLGIANRELVTPLIEARKIKK
jgi:hypothetical protein